MRYLFKPFTYFDIIFTMMKTKVVLYSIFFILTILSCKKSVNYTPEYMQETSGRYLYNQDDIIEVFYENNRMFFKWRGAEKLKPVILDDKTFIIVEMDQKFHFLQNPETKERFLSKIPKDNEDLISYDYIKVADSFKVPSMHLKDKNYDKAMQGYLEIQKQDSTSLLIEESSFNSLGYQLLREKKYEDAIGVFKINVALYPESGNVYDSLADAYVRKGDSLQAFNYYKMALVYNSGNRRAKEFSEAYKKNNDLD